jgi:CheY-like chemotaxis protein
MFLALTINMVAGARVLVADDDRDLLDAICEVLTDLGADVSRALNGAELIENLADKGPFDLVVTDIAMPWMTGIQAMHAARTAGLGTSVVVMTALADEGIAVRVEALGKHAALLRKPFDLTELESVASMLLERRSTEVESQSRPSEGVRKVAS